MVWLYDGNEPDEYKVKIGIQKLDTDSDGNIDMLEWITYLCLRDKITGNLYFMGRLRKKFIQMGKFFFFYCI